MNILYYDCFAGISGDMNLAAMMNLGVELDYVQAELSKLGIDDEFELRVTSDSRCGICGTRVDVILKKHQQHSHHHESHGHEHHHEHTHGHEHAHHHHGCGHAHGDYRNLRDIESIIMASTLSDAVKETSMKIFRKVAQAESHVHGKPADEVHFHEVGATDSIVDIVGAAICYHRLSVDAVWASPVELGGGFSHCVHGLIPVPAPATVEILHGIPTTRGRTQHEMTTPTGAAILASLVDTFTDTPAMTTQRTGYGIGHRETEIPNVLRVHLAVTEMDS